MEKKCVSQKPMQPPRPLLVVWLMLEPPAAAWRQGELRGRWELREPLTYAVRPSLCEAVQPHFRETRLLPLWPMRCADVLGLVRQALLQWSANEPALCFRELHPDAQGAALSIDADELDDALLGVADVDVEWSSAPNASAAVELLSLHSRIVRARIRISREACWYTENQMCALIARYGAWPAPLLAGVGALSAMFALTLLLFGSRHGLPLLPMGLLLSLSAASALCYWGVVLPCTECSDFRAVVSHELGHALGFAHSDAERGSNASATWGRCGCHPEAISECAPEQPGARDASTMLTASRHNWNYCISQSDADGLHALYATPLDNRSNASRAANANATCAAVVCEAETQHAGALRLALATLYALVLGLVGVGALACLGRLCRLATRAPSAPREALPYAAGELLAEPSFAADVSAPWYAATPEPRPPARRGGARRPAQRPMRLLGATSSSRGSS